MIEQQPFGKTGHTSSRVIYGAAGLGRASPEQGERILALLMQYGVNHIDVAASYAQGESEKRVGMWMQRHRDRFFLATKTGMRTYEEAKAELAASLERLQVDHVDLIQMHNLTAPEDWETAMGAGGALEALLEAQNEGLTRFIGVTGHGFTAPDMHLRSIQRFDAASVLLPWNYLLGEVPAYAAGFRTLLGTCRQQGVAVQTIKSIARKPWHGRERTKATYSWYQPLEARADIDRAVRWVLSEPHVFLASASDPDLLAHILQSASHVAPKPADGEMREMIQAQEMEHIFEGGRSISG